MAEPNELRRFKAVVYGRVQGVGFRQFAKERADAFGLSGYVRNLWDRTVEVEAEGTEQDIQDFLDWLHHGPPMAHVVKVNVHWLAPTGEYTGFEVSY
ncbi:MAG: acylphosphatase [Anaerolineae bacterium]